MAARRGTAASPRRRSVVLDALGAALLSVQAIKGVGDYLQSAVADTVAYAEQVREMEMQLEKLLDEMAGLDAQVELVKTNRLRINELLGHTQVFATALAAGEISVEEQQAMFSGLHKQAGELDAGDGFQPLQGAMFQDIFIFFAEDFQRVDHRACQRAACFRLSGQHQPGLPQPRDQIAHLLAQDPDLYQPDRKRVQDL